MDEDISSPRVVRHRRGAQAQGGNQTGHVPQALQMLFPTSSLRHNGVVLVPQLAQLSAPTWLRTRDRLLLGACELITGDDSAPDVSAPGSATGGADASAFCAGGGPLTVSTVPAWIALL